MRVSQYQSAELAHCSRLVCTGWTCGQRRRIQQGTSLKNLKGLLSTKEARSNVVMHLYLSASVASLVSGWKAPMLDARFC